MAKVILSLLKTTNALVSGKKLLVYGENFDEGAVILLNGERQKTANDEEQPRMALIAKKSGKKIGRGVPSILQVRNADGTFSNEFSFTRPISEAP